jgi:hypothetical protein
MNTLKTLQWKYLPLLIVILFTFLSTSVLIAQDEEPIIYYQMEPLDDSLFIQIQEQLFIDPPDPKAEIIVDLRNENDQTISIKGALYPLLALAPETRARIVTYPFKLNLEETIHFGSVFSRVIEKIRFKKVVNPPSKFQISSTLGYINPFLQLFGGERFGWSLKRMWDFHSVLKLNILDHWKQTILKQVFIFLASTEEYIPMWMLYTN